MPVSSVVVQCLEGKADSVASQIAEFEGIEIHGVLPHDQIVAVIEAVDISNEVDLVSALHDVKNVVSVRLAYHNFEDI